VQLGTSEETYKLVFDVCLIGKGFAVGEVCGIVNFLLLTANFGKYDE